MPLRLPRETVDRYQFIAEHERCLAPDEDVADPAAGTALPFRAEAVDVAAGHPDRSSELAGLSFEPQSASDHERREHRDDDQIDAESDEQRDQHGLPFRPAGRPTRGAQTDV